MSSPAVQLPHLPLLFAACCALFQVALTALVIARRVKTEIRFLEGGDAVLLHRIRAHGNFTETVPMALLLMALLELRGLGSAWLWAFGAALLLGRALHVHGLLSVNAKWARVAGMLATLAVISTEALAGLWMHLAR